VDGLLVIDKPAGPTSHDMVDLVRRLAGLRRVGHTGTLDPAATGVLPICLGRATRLSRFLTGSRKVYDAVIVLGVQTDTDDASGRPIRQRDASGVSEERIHDAAGAFLGVSSQIPPPFSARRVGGRRMHELARAGETVVAPAFPVTVHRLEITKIAGSLVHVTVEVSAGTYIRSLARDLGESLGCGAHLGALRRTAAGGIGLAMAHDVESLQESAARGGLPELVVPLERMELGLSTAVTSPEGAEAMQRGRRLDATLVRRWPEPPAEPGSPVRVLDPSGRLLGVATAARDDAGESLHPAVVLEGR
jgi:tRNA pseudouridine55 synthase